MLRNDRVRDIRMDSVYTRDLYRAVERHHKNNPHVSMEAAFAYVMSNSSTFRALPAACIEKARKYLALPNQEDDAKAEFKKASSEKLSDIFAGLNEALQELADSGQPLFITPLGPPDSEGNTPIKWECNGIPTFDIKEALEAMRMPLYSVEFQEGDQQDKPIGITEHDLKHNDEMFIHPATTITPIPNSGDDFPLFLITVDQPTKSSLPGSPDTSSLGVIKTPAKPKPGTTVVHAERVVVDNKKMVRILKFENIMKFGELPIEYKTSFPNFHESGSGIALLVKSGEFAKVNIIYAGDAVSHKHFGQIIKTMKEAGVRLSKINKTVKLEKEHSGKFTVSI